MNEYKTCVYAICKNEEQFVDRWMDSMSEADLIVVTDTGSDDGTVEKLKAKGAIVYIDPVKPWRFDNARNISLNHVPEDVDICVCTDLDEIFNKGWRQLLEQNWTPDAKSGKYIYNWSLHPDGTPDVQLYYTKIHSRKGFSWKHPVHEWLSYSGLEPFITVDIDGMVLNHYPDASKSRSSYLPLLELAVREEPDGSRENYYLGREYMYKSQWQNCIDTLKHYLELPHSVWVEERSAAMRWIAKSYYQLQNIKQAYSWYYKAIAETPDMRDPYVECAKMGYLIADWPTVFYMAEEALKINEKSRTFVNMGYAWDYTPHDLAAISCYRLGLFERARDHAILALESSPDDERLKNNLRMIEKKIV